MWQAGRWEHAGHNGSIGCGEEHSVGCLASTSAANAAVIATSQTCETSKDTLTMRKTLGDVSGCFVCRQIAPDGCWVIMGSRLMRTRLAGFILDQVAECCDPTNQPDARCEGGWPSGRGACTQTPSKQASKSICACIYIYIYIYIYTCTCVYDMVLSRRTDAVLGRGSQLDDKGCYNHRSLPAEDASL